jgi:hypothetical protein
MPTKGRKRSASKQTPDIKIMQFPPNPERERLVTKMLRELIVCEVLRSFGVDVKKYQKRRKKKERELRSKPHELADLIV